MAEEIDLNANNNLPAGRQAFFQSPKSLIVFIIAVLAIGSIAAYSFISSNKKINPPLSNNPSIIPQQQLQSSNMIVYGVWRDNKSYIKGYDTGNKKEYLIANLPISIKKVTVISPTKLLYVGETDDKDHGKNLSIFDTATKKSTVIYESRDKFGIDDYVISSNKKYVATWEVLFKEGAKVLTGGRSRMYSLEIDNPALRNLIYDEPADKAIHYPRAILSDGTIFSDTFLPNSGAGWAYGMSISDFQGKNKKNLDNMKNGTYGTLPSISPNEKYLVFSGYDKADGTEIEKEFRKAIIKANTIELLDTQTLDRRPLQNLPNTNIYSSAFFDKTGKVIFQADGTFAYDLLTNTFSKVDTEQESFAAFISDQTILLGEKTESLSSVENLGGGYNITYNKFLFFNLQTKNTESINLKDNFMQYITIVPPGFFNNLEGINEFNNKALQLQTFSFKPSLAPKRKSQQTKPLDPSRPLCEDIIAEICKKYIVNGRPVSGFSKCQESILGSCLWTPLYLYGKPETLVNIKVNSYVYSSDPLYDPKTGYNVKILDNGKMEINGKIYDRINYDYLSQKVSPPLNGIITSKEELSETLKYFAKNLGLNQKETGDLLDFGNKNIKSPFIFISFYDQKTSEQILPLEFTPAPSTYINIVFYFKEYMQRPELKPQPPVFKTPLRSRFTAVEISEILEK